MAARQRSIFRQPLIAVIRNIGAADRIGAAPGHHAGAMAHGPAKIVFVEKVLQQLADSQTRAAATHAGNVHLNDLAFHQLQASSALGGLAFRIANDKFRTGFRRERHG